jgi:hypothetical protein
VGWAGDELGGLAFGSGGVVWRGGHDRGGGGDALWTNLAAAGNAQAG